MSYRDQIEHAAQELGEDLVGQLLGEASALGRDGVRRILEIIRRRREREESRAFEAAHDRVDDALEKRLRRDSGEGHQ